MLTQMLMTFALAYLTIGVLFALFTLVYNKGDSDTVVSMIEESMKRSLEPYEITLVKATVYAQVVLLWPIAISISLGGL